jgi:hypothetical protein
MNNELLPDWRENEVRHLADGLGLVEPKCSCERKLQARF